MLPDQPHVTLSSSQNRIFQYVDQMLLMMEPFADVETDNDIEQIEEITVSLSNFGILAYCCKCRTKLFV